MLIILLAALFGTIPPLTDLASTADHASSHKQPIVIYVSRSQCTFCGRFEREVLAPLIKSGEFSGRVQFRELMMDGTSPVRDFSGEPVSPADLAARMDVQVTPTLLFLDSTGRPLAPPMRGYNSSEFFSYYFERSISRAIARIAQ